MSVEIYGTLGPACADAATLAQMIDAGMTGIRLNLSHMTLREAQPYLDAVRAAERESGRSIGLLLDMQGPELRVGQIREPMVLEEGARVVLGEGGIPLPEEALCAVTKGQVILLDDGRLRLRAESADHALVERGGVLRSRKSAALPGVEISLPAMTAQDRENLELAPSCGVTAVMQPFVRNADDLKTVRAAMTECGGTDIRLFAKIENRRGMDALAELLPKAAVACADATEKDVLLEAGIMEFDGFVALTGLDEMNIIYGMYAKAKNVSKVIAKIQHITFREVIENSGIESIISPKQITAERISSYVRAVQNSFAQNKVESLRTLVGGSVEALEFVVRDQSNFIGVPLKDLNIKKNTLIAAIVRHGSVIIPGGGDCIRFGDSVIVITAGMIIDELGDIMR